MAHPDARLAVVQHLTQAAVGELPSPRDAPANSPSRPTPGISHGLPFTADPATIRFVKDRGTVDRRLCAVTFSDQQDNDWFYLVAAECDDTECWTAHAVAGGSGAIPQRSQPWLNFCGQWGRPGLYAGGEIHTAGADVDRITLTLADGRQLTDDAEANVALFVDDLPAEQPVRIEIYAIAGRLLASHEPI